MCQQQILPSNAINMAYAQITLCAYIEEYANIRATYETAPSNDVDRITVHRQRRHIPIIYKVRHLAVSVENRKKR